MIARPAALKDGPGIARVLVSGYNIKDEEEAISVIKDEVAKGHKYLVAEENGEVIGIVTWLPHGLPKHGLAELDRIAVLPEFKGKGVSDALKDAMVSDAKQWFEKKTSALRKLYILTHEDNARARKFYERMGFSLETTLKDHYYAGKNECVYSMFF